MKDGLDGDDIYIMVEDEFHAVAKMFTQHLHHAEYMRLKNLAKGRTASTVATISRPVDPITAMRPETKQKKQAETRDIRTNAALQQIKSSAARPASDDDSGLSDADNAPWRGTALQDLMTVSPTKNQISLTGLHGVKSSTRAAAGYSKAASKPSQPKVKAIDLRPNSVKPASSKPTHSEGSTVDESSTDDLDAPPIVRSELRTSKPSRNPAPRTLLQISPPPNAPQPFPPHHRNKPPPSSRLKKHPGSLYSYPTPDSDSDPDPGSNSAGNPRDKSQPARVKQSEATRRRLKARIARREAEREKYTGEGGGSGGALAAANDIPVFLV